MTKEIIIFSRKEYLIEYRNKHKEKYKEYNKTYYKNNKHISDLYRIKNKLKTFLGYAKYRANKKEIPFDLTEDDLVIPAVCPYLGIDLTYILGEGKLNTDISLDRIDSKLGYTKDNIQIISFLANRMKSNATEDQLIAFAKGVLKLHAGIDVDKIITELGKIQQIPGLCEDKD